MAGEWIKMRTNLWDDPRVAAICDATDSTEATVIGGLYWLWATADEHTESGILPGLSLRSIDRKAGIPGFGEALIDVGWLTDHEHGVRIVNFEEHNGTSAKKRALTSKRVASHRAGNGDETQQLDERNAGVTHEALQETSDSVTGALAREDIEKINRKDSGSSEGSRSKSAKSDSQRASRLPPDWTPTPENVAFCQRERPDLDVALTVSKFRDYWIALPGAKGKKVDWAATWRTWVRNEKPQARASPPFQTSNQQAKNLADRLTGNARHDRTEPHIIDIN